MTEDFKGGCTGVRLKPRGKQNQAILVSLLVEYAPGSYWCFCGTCGRQHTADKRAWRCLECAEKARDTPAPVSVKVKPLEWHGWDENTNYPQCSSLSDVGYRYKIDTSEGRWKKPEFPVFFRASGYENFTRIAECNSYEEAKAAAQADYEARIRSALEEN